RQFQVGIEGPVTGVEPSQAGGHLPVGDVGGDAELGAAHARTLDVVGQADRRVEGDQVIDPRVECIQAQVDRAVLPADAQLGRLRLLRPQVRVAEERVVQLVEGRRLERGAPARTDPPATGEVEAPGEAAGGVPAELLVVIAAHRRLQAMAPRARLVLGEGGAVVALVGDVHGVAVDTVAYPVHAHAEQVVAGQAEVALQAGAVAVGVEEADVGAVVELVGGIHVAAGRELELGGVGWSPAHAAADHLLQGLGAVAVVAVEVVLTLAAQPLGRQLPMAEVDARTQRERVLDVAVEVGFGGADEAPARERGGLGDVAGVESFGALERVVGADPGTPFAAGEADAVLVRAVAAATDVHARRPAGGVAAGKDLDHPADRLAAVQARARPADNL